MSRRTKAFTLVELLIVIGIIALLISILMPALSGARKEAQRVNCQSNMKQIMTATIMYETENRGFLPYPCWGSGNASGVYAFGWLYSYPTPAWPPTTADRTTDVQSGELWPYLKNETVFHCSQWDPTLPVPGTELLTDFLMNGSICGFGTLGTSSTAMVPSYPITKYHGSSSGLIVYWEANEASSGPGPTTGAVWNDGSSYPSEEGLATRHMKGANAAYLDGHVEWMSPSSFLSEAQANGFSSLWFSPASSNGH